MSDTDSNDSFDLDEYICESDRSSELNLNDDKTIKHWLFI